MSFNLVDYIKKNLINGYADGTWSESKVAQLSIGYLTKGLITEEDIAEVDIKIEQIKAEREAEKLAREVYADEDIEDIGEDAY